MNVVNLDAARTQMPFRVYMAQLARHATRARACADDHAKVCCTTLILMAVDGRLPSIAQPTQADLVTHPISELIVGAHHTRRVLDEYHQRDDYEDIAMQWAAINGVAV